MTRHDIESLHGRGSESEYQYSFILASSCQVELRDEPKGAACAGLEFSASGIPEPELCSNQNFDFASTFAFATVADACSDVDC